jgi:hypothetical protein
MVNRRPVLHTIAPAASPSEAAAITAALERFMRETAPALAPAPREPDRWLRAAILEGVERDMPGKLRDPWINT